ncbi:uncharacterized protein LOC125506791 [Triticum urartu]|uniref:uncharacterized protein LOC125506791 n=1 Tax=Triticum urartu TaxID=4572 RepID=UPI0020437C80|nr:uncharacterized protein LOC125506791 [Triticum urartu]
MAKDIGFKDGDELYYTIPGCSLDEGIDLIHDDNSIVKMLNFAKKHNFAEIYVKHKGNENTSADPRSGLGNKDKLPAENTKSKESKFASKKRDKRTWTAKEEKLLIEILYNMNDSSWKVDTGHKSGYLTYIEKEMAKVLPHADLKADPHIKSKVKILKKQLSYVLEIMQNSSGFGWDDEKKMVTGDRETYMGWAKVQYIHSVCSLYMKPMVNFDKLCEVYATELAKGGSAKGPGEEETPEVGSTAETQPTSEHAKENLPESHENTNPLGSSRPSRKRTYIDDYALESGLISVSNTIAKFLEAKQENAKTMNGLQRAFMHEAQVHEQTSANRTKLLEILQNLKGLTTEEVVMVVRVIGGDAGKTELFIQLRDDYKVVFVRRELEAAKK